MFLYNCTALISVIALCLMKSRSTFWSYNRKLSTVWINGLLFKLFTELGIEGRMWLAIKDLYTGVKAQVLYSG